jgi:iron only hydrogenase large subunit-like protein
MKKKLYPVIGVDKDKCVNCRKCISVCPVKFCNDCSEGYMQINPDLCIGCGACIDACTHDARFPLDDLQEFLKDIKTEKIISIAAPSVASNFPDKYLSLNGWLKSLGIEAIFDVSFGAELTIKSYIEFIKKNSPKLVISQPCPAIVSFIEIYKPELLPYLAPADSPMLHTIKMIREYYPQYNNYKIAVISPCLAKKREFEETGYGDYNVTYQSLDKYFKENDISLDGYPETDFDNPPAERAVIFSSPGGLLRTAERDLPGISKKTRKIEGIEIIYHYLSKLPEMLEKGMNPLLVDCLSCEIGCNGGPGTLNRGKSPDETEFYIEKRNKEMQEKYKPLLSKNNKQAVNKILNRYWKEGFYKRSYLDLSDNFDIKLPNEVELKKIYEKMHKYSEADLYNCASCGYGLCEKMAIAIFNGLNNPENCQFYNESVVEMEKERKAVLSESISEAIKEIDSNASSISEVTNRLLELSDYIEKQIDAVDESTSLVGEVLNSINTIAKLTDKEKVNSKKLIKITKIGGKKIHKTNSMIGDVSKNADSIVHTIDIINEIAKKTDLLSMNASIEAAHAGDSGKGFMVVADEIRALAESTTNNANNISSSLKDMILKIRTVIKYSSRSEKAFIGIMKKIKKVTNVFLKLSQDISNLSGKTTTISDSLQELSEITEEIKSSSTGMKRNYTVLTDTINNVKEISGQILDDISEIRHINKRSIR